MLALVDNKPRVLNLRDLIYYYLEHQKDVIIRRTKYDLARAEERVHVLEGLKIALDHIDEVIAIIRGSRDIHCKGKVNASFQPFRKASPSYFRYEAKTPNSSRT